MKAIRSSKTSSGFTLTELMIVIAIIGLLATLAMPSLARARDTSRLNMIYSNLRSLDHAKDQWAIDNNKASGTPLDDLSVLDKYFRWGGIRDVFHETYLPTVVGAPSEAVLPPGVSLGPFGPGATIPAP